MGKIKKIELIAFLSILIVVCGIGLISFYIDNNRLHNRLETFLEHISGDVEKFFQNSVKETVDNYNIKIESLLKTEGVIEAFENRDREKLYKLSLRAYNRFTEENPHSNR